MDNSILKSNFTKGVIWNYISMVVMTISGFMYTMYIMGFHDATILGVFNQAYAYYLLLSQLAVFGVHLAIVKYAAQYSNDKNVLKVMLSSALILTMIVSVLMITLVETIGYILIPSDNQLWRCLRFVLPGLFFFSLNKVMLGYLNGISQMQLYAKLQSVRSVLIVVFVVIISMLMVEPIYLAMAFPLTEVFLFGVNMVIFIKRKLIGGEVNKEWIREIFQFGYKIMPSNLVLDLNTKADIVCLSLLLRNDYLIGIYSVVTLFTDGLYQVYVVVRRSVNPHLTELYYTHDLGNKYESLRRMIRKWNRIVTPIVIVLVIGVFGGMCFFTGKEYLRGVFSLVIICSAIGANGVYIILGNICAQSGFPVQESIVNVVTLIINLCFNVILILFVGLEGAAIATAISYYVYAMVLKREINKIILNNE